MLGRMKDISVSNKAATKEFNSKFSNVDSDISNLIKPLTEWHLDIYKSFQK